MKRLVIIVLIIIMLLSAGCWDLREINQSSVSTGAGVDLDNAGKVLFSTQLVQAVPPGETGSVNTPAVVVTSTGTAIAETARRQMHFLSRVPEWAHTSSFIIGEKLARHDLSILADFMVRNRHIRPDANLLIAVNTTPREVFSTPVPLSTNSGQGLRDILDIQGKQLGIYVPTTMQEFIAELATPGIEPAVPQITVETEENRDKPAGKANNKDEDSGKPQKKIILNGMSVFKGRRMVGSLNETESRGYRWLNATNNKSGLMVVNSPLKKGDHVTLRITDFDSQTRPQIKNGQIRMTVSIKAEMNFYDQDGTGELLTPSMIKALEGYANRKIKQEIAACINQSQTLNSDILGWGQTIHRYRPEVWEEIQNDWVNIYPGVASDIKVETTIKESYLSKSTFRFK